MDRKVYEYISTQTKDPVVEWKTCPVSRTDFPIFQSDLDFYDKISPVFNGVKYAIPTPKLCPELRHMRRMLFRNDRSLYRRTCDATGAPIICMFAPDKPYTVYNSEYRRSDKWSGLDYGQDFDFSRSFGEQFNELLHSVPLPGVLNSNSHNAEYVNQTGNMKNSYLMFSCMDSEHCYYGNRIFSSSYCVDCAVVYNAQQCYECIDGHNLYACFFSQNIRDCKESYFLFDCIGCSNCFGCWNLRNQAYCIWNIQHTPEAYALQIAELKKQMRSYIGLQALRAKMKSMIQDHAILRNMYLDHCEHTYGAYLYDSKHSIACYEGGELESTKYGLMLHNTAHVQDGNNSTGAQRQYEVSTGGIQGYNVLFSVDARPQNSYVMYSAYTPNCSNVFACVGLKQQSYCILNKQYTKEEYEALVPKIIEHMQETGEWGEFFDPSYSPFGYNESAAWEYFPLEKSQTESFHFPRYEGISTVFPSSSTLPDNIDDVDDTILSQAIACEAGGKAFKIIAQELAFYRKHGLPIPRISSDMRHLQRFNQKPARTLHLRHCDKCETEMLSVYPGDFEGKVYCETCYNKEIYG